MGTDDLTNDLEFLQNMIKYQTEDAIFANAAFIKLSSHTWYLTKTAVAFSFLSNHFMMPAKVKKLRLLSTSSLDEFGSDISHFRAKIDAQTQLPDLVGPETCFFCFKRSI